MQCCHMSHMRLQFELWTVQAEKVRCKIKKKVKTQMFTWQPWFLCRLPKLTINARIIFGLCWVILSSLYPGGPRWHSLSNKENKLTTRVEADNFLNVFDHAIGRKVTDGKREEAAAASRRLSYSISARNWTVLGSRLIKCKFPFRDSSGQGRSAN